MAKKKSKAVSNRGYATVSAPSKKIEPVVVVPATVEPEIEVVKQELEHPFESLPSLHNVEKEQDKEMDPVLKLVQKYESLNDHKAQAAFDRLLKDDSQQVSDERVKKFRLDAEIEKDLLQVVKHKDSDIFNCFNRPLKNSSNEYDKERIISQFDVLYRTLIRLGFQIEDISASFEATLSKSIDDHLDWLCVHVPYERMPIGFFDKYYNEDDNEYLVLLHNNAANKRDIKDDEVKPVEIEEKEELVQQEKKVVVEEKKDDMKARILQAAQQQMDEEDEDIHEIYATKKIKMTELEKLLPSNKPNKKSKKKSKDELAVPILSDTEIDKLRKDIKKLKESLISLEADWDFDKNKADALYTKQAEKIEIENRQKLAEARAQLKKEQEEQKNKGKEIEPVKEEGSDDEDDDEGGLFGGLMMDDDEVTPSTPGATVKFNIVDLSVPKSWMGRYPKDLLLDYCNKHKLGQQKFNTSTVSSGIWQSSLKVIKDGYSSIPLRFELPKELCTNNKHDAEQLVAFYALFELDSYSSLFKVLPNPYKDLWNEWLEEKRLKEEAPRIEADKKRLSFLIDLVDKSFSRPNSKDNSKTDNVTNEAAVTSSRQNMSKNKKMFSRVKENFKSRLTNKDYIAMKQKRNSLPITAYREQILEIMKDNQVLIISGETGCGKSTQVPQFLAEDILLGATEMGSVVCTQPRRISAMSIANRVSSEMGDRARSTGSRDAMVGYQIRLESRMSAENVLLFCTTGILLRRLESDKNLDGVTHVVVDEVHERTIESDFLLIILRKLLETRTDLKVILMSATVEASRFSNYFGKCPVVSVPGRTYPVHVQYLEDVLEDTGYVLEEDSPFAVRRIKVKTEVGNINVSGQSGSSKRVHYEMFEEDSDDDDPYDPTRIESKLTIVDQANDDDDTTNNEPIARKYCRQTRKMIKRMDEKKINYDLILELLDHICLPKKSQTELEVESEKQYELESKGFNVPDKGAILVFLPGMNEIRKIYDVASSHSLFGDPKKFLLIALHSALSSEHQEKAFDIPPDGVRKIVFSTNIAETGVTISDVTVVIDTGMAKVVSYDEKKRVTRLLQKYVAKANARQRRGRAGRVQEGVCFHLFTEKRFEEMANFETPEILRLPLEELCLRIKVCNLGSIRDVLGAALDPPTQKMIDNAILTLQEVQALTVDGNESLTPLGAHLSNLPVDVHIGKMILFGAIFKCLDPILTIAASLSFKSPFVRPFGKEDEADAARARFRIDNSDFLTVYKAYVIWREHYLEAKQSNISHSSLIRKMRNFCKDNFLSQQNLEMIEDMKRQYLGLLISIGFVKTDENPDINHYDVKRSLIQLCKIPKVYNLHAESIPVVNAALTAGLYPKIAEYLRQSSKIVNKDMELDIHPSSMLFGKKKTLLSEFLIYNTVVMNSNSNQMKDRVYMWETASIDAVAVILLATNIDIKENGSR
ncbi:P-loop containing nucleoside triphosphate hydrolase protein [Helicostylum pulchrum]|nr:P-loop containing nucleoside triphosphate hydrolase protein [Helicostylum pulchrum]